MKKLEINKIEYIKINGCYHFFYHRGSDFYNPVIIFLHGGPGSSELVFANAFQDKLEDKYTIIHYDQRGTGKTYNKNKSLAKPRLDDLVSDLDEIIKYIKSEYKKDKVILLGHSFGSILGSIYIRKYPENVEAYIGTGQVISILENERIGFMKLKEVVSLQGKKRDLKKIENLKNFPYENFHENIYKVRKLQNKYKLSCGGLREIKIAIKSKMFGFRDLIAIIKSIKINSELREDIRPFELCKEGIDYKVPIFYILGDRDWQTPYTIAVDYFDKIIAPKKKLYILKDSGHFTMLDNKLGFKNALYEIYDELKNYVL